METQIDKRTRPMASTKRGCRRRGVWMRATCFLAFIGGACIVQQVGKFLTADDTTTAEDGIYRRLQLELGDCSTHAAEFWPLAVGCVVGVLYMFVAIAIVCDEYFVPALEELASERFLNLSMDVAGATLMAAGGSAPELFTSLIGTFQRSEVGFGTIVGSAVFNVLFVIGVCAVASKEILTLTWWPLARDCTYYSITLGTLALFCGYLSPGVIELWEAAVQFGLYLGYVILMAFNTKLEGCFKRKSKTAADDDVESEIPKSSQRHIQFSTFRAGLLDIFLGETTLMQQAGIRMVCKLGGPEEEAFAKINESGDGHIDMDELKKLFQLLNCPVTEEELEEIMKMLDTNEDGKIDLSEFKQWYAHSEAHLKTELRRVFHEFDVDNSNTIDASELKKLMEELGTPMSDEDMEQALRDTLLHIESNAITFQDFEAWYLQTPYWDEKKINLEKAAAEAEDEPENLLRIPRGEGFGAYLRWLLLLPIVIVTKFTIPDVRKSGREKYAIFSFFAAIAWIGASSYFMVTWAEIIGKIFGIPSFVMGITILAAGTSVPDLLSSVIVARQGEGDMAVSSSVGSNIFDVAVGLPLPWLVFIAWPNGENSVSIGTDGLAISVLILFGMIIAIITAIHLSGWKMTKTLGYSMFILYAGYLAQAIVRELPFENC